MTDAERRDRAIAFLKLTKSGYAKALADNPNAFAKTNWGCGLAELAMIGKVLPPPPPPPPAKEVPLGVYCWGQNPDGVDAFGQWLGRKPDLAEDFLAGDNWEGIEGPGWILDPWNGRYTLILGLPLFPPGGTLQAGARGDYDQHFQTLARNLVAKGQADCILRPGWEFGGGWYMWNPDTQQEASDFAAFFRRIVTAMRSVAPALRFDWNDIWGWQAVDPSLAYPGDAYVDFIGVDVYDQSWYPQYQDGEARWNNFIAAGTPYGYQWFTTFAAAHGKPLSFPEWGPAIRADGHGGGDYAPFITHMEQVIENPPAPVGYHVIFTVRAPDGDHDLLGGKFPRSAAEFKRAFGS